MDIKIVVNATRRETRVGVIEDGRLAELRVEREERVVGNVYKGRVEQVVPGLNAAFVNVGLERNAFLAVGDAVPEDPVNRNHRGRRPAAYDLPPISDVVKMGQEILVQVMKGPVEAKGARISARISLPGKYSVLMAQSAHKVGISRKITDEAARDRLRKMGDKVCPTDCGIIIRTQAEEVTLQELRRDVSYLGRQWKKLEKASQKLKAPSLVHKELSLSEEALRDIFTEDVTAFIVDNEAVYTQLIELLGDTAPKLQDRVELYQGEGPIFDHYGIEDDIEKALHRKVWLPSGGYLIIDPTEALTCIDVNTGKFTGTGGLEETVFRTNMEATREISRQLRLRDIGGIIVIDFIDMDLARHRRDVTMALKEALKHDRVKTRVVHLTPLGLIEMTRKRTGQTLAQKLHVACPTCEGYGKVLSPESVCIRIENALAQEARHARAMQVVANPSVALHLLGEDGEEADTLQEVIGKPVFVRCANRVHPEDFRIETGAVRDFQNELAELRVRSIHPLRPDQIIEAPFGGVFANVHGYALRLPDFTMDMIEEGMQIKITKKGRHMGEADVIFADGRTAKVRARDIQRALEKERAELEKARQLAKAQREEEERKRREQEAQAAAQDETEGVAPRKRRRRRKRRRSGEAAEQPAEAMPAEETSVDEAVAPEPEPALPDEEPEALGEEDAGGTSRPRRGRRRRRRRPQAEAVSTEDPLLPAWLTAADERKLAKLDEVFGPDPLTKASAAPNPLLELLPDPLDTPFTPPAEAVAPPEKQEPAPAPRPKRRRRRSGSRSPQTDAVPDAGQPETIVSGATAAAASELEASGVDSAAETTTAESDTTTAPTKRRRSRRRRRSSRAAGSGDSSDGKTSGDEASSSPPPADAPAAD